MKTIHVSTSTSTSVSGSSNIPERIRPIVSILRKTSFKNLKPSYKKSLIQRWEEHYEVNVKDSSIQNLEVWSGLVPTPELLKFMSKYPFYKEDGHKTINDWHKWYIDQTHIKDHGNSKWPIILWDYSEEPFEDGWHRLNSYLKSNDKEIPIVYCPEAYTVLGD